MNNLISSLQDWLNRWPDVMTSPPVVFIVGFFNSFTSIALAIPTTLGAIEVFRVYSHAGLVRVIANTLLILILAVAVVWSIASYIRGDDLLAAQLGVGALILFLIFKGLPWIWRKIRGRKPKESKGWS